MGQSMKIEARAALCLILLLSSCSGERSTAVELALQTSGTTVRLQAVSVVDENIVWASGLDGTVLITTDGGDTWAAISVAGAESLQLRDIDAIDDRTAYVLSSGTGEDSRIFKTVDGGVTWIQQYVNPDPEGFLDCMGFWDATHGAVYGDAVDGSLVVLTTDNGESWTRVPDTNLPEALPGEGGFAASGTCLITHGDSVGYIATGAASEARVLKTHDRGLTWAAAAAPLGDGTGNTGLTTVGMHDGLTGMAAGGDISRPESHINNIAVTVDGGSTWSLGSPTVFPGAVYGVAVVPGAATPTVVAVGPGGADYSADNGETWEQLDSREYWSVAFANQAAGWAVGPDGRIAKISFMR